VTLAGRGRMRRDRPNALTLDICRWRKGEEPWSEPIPVISLQEQLEREKYVGPLSLRFTFQVTDVPPQVHVVVEDAENYHIEVNGHTVSYAGLPYYIDRAFHPVEITPLVRPGENTVDLHVSFRPLGQPSFFLAGLFEKQEGVELESIYVVGDFAVRGEVSDAEARPGCLRYRPTFRLEREPETTTGNLTAEGYPFFAGRATYTEDVTLRAPAANERVLLHLPGLDAVLAKVFVNGQEAGAVLWPPHMVEITRWVREGENRIAVELVSSLRNLLGPHHRSTGEPSHTWADAFEFPPDRHRAKDPIAPGATWTDDYFVVHFGLRGPLRVEYLRPV
ncbi:MAG: hypothetical protein QHJ73_16695, partial [Armatimonadota bacterium]|nr:hypothetical protein [Armatimonadota bacterium]